MKYKTTKKDVINGYYKVFKIGYCDLQYLLYYENPIAYCSGVYGWSCDIYDFGSIAISTGYNPIGKQVDFDITKKYNDEARKIQNNFGSYEDNKKKTKKLLNKFIKYLTSL